MGLWITRIHHRQRIPDRHANNRRIISIDGSAVTNQRIVGAFFLRVCESIGIVCRHTILLETRYARGPDPARKSVASSQIGSFCAADR